ncbi:hypothetical protein SteCoe_19224 [Stentor coeruleus]|uniref:Uncharacterized protein n=1 Tax=Stentor coeruleus TaxID=5963 RepID=A0A1R2BV43_9CILI|nr:hypothetical protein SteCoe_19224 [Stentor coeruleus]
MHKTSDLDYCISETHQAFYPSLMSPLKCFMTPSPPKSSHQSIFERLQADTELRLRARQNSASPPKYQKQKLKIPIEDILIQKGKQRDLRRRDLIELNEIKKLSELQNKPFINPNSQSIIKNKFSSFCPLCNSENSQEKPINSFYSDGNKLITSEDYKNSYSPIVKKVSLVNDNSSPISKSPKLDEKTVNKSSHKTKIKDNNSHKQILLKQLEDFSKKINGIKQCKSEEKICKSPEIRYSDRNYIPIFTKPFDVNKIMSSRKYKKRFSELSFTIRGLNMKPEEKNFRPITRPISDVSVAVSDIGNDEKNVVRNRKKK